MNEVDIKAAAMHSAQAGAKTQEAVLKATRQVVLGTKFLGVCAGAFTKALFTKSTAGQQG